MIIFTSSSDPKLLSTNIPLGKILIFPPWQLNIYSIILAISPLQGGKIFRSSTFWTVANYNGHLLPPHGWRELGVHGSHRRSPRVSIILLVHNNPTT